MEHGSLVERAQAALRANDLDTAEELLRLAIRTHPEDETAWLLLAQVVSDIQEAVSCLRRVLELNPANDQARQWLLLVQDETEDLDARKSTAHVQQASVPPLGTFLVECGLITPEQLQAALDIQAGAAAAGIALRIGEILVEEAMISAEQLRYALQAQEDMRRQRPPVPRLGEYLLDHHFITPEQLDAALAAQKAAIRDGVPKKIGELLIEQGAITRHQLDHALREQHSDYASLFQD